MTVIGDVRYEMRAPLHEQLFTTIDQDAFCFAKIEKIVSGTAVNMARAAQSLFRTTVIAKIGNDELTPLIKDQSQRIDADWRFIVDPRVPNGLVIIVRDSAMGKHGGNRLLVSGLPAPGLLLSAADVRSQSRAIQQSDVLMVDGYSLLSPCGRDALATALELAGGARVVRCMDLVPHNIHDFLGFADLEGFLRSAEIVVSSARTVATLLGERVAYPACRDDVRALLDRVLQLKLPPRYWILRFGIGDVQETVIQPPQGQSIFYSTGYVETDDHAGFGDRLTVWELHQILMDWNGG
ncbi:carbohydrate kinase family protein [Actinomadura citrea]|uniref:carbohydrate kinase family protein n=1 Tax=Actinomadura citrea TaxID=46158 RepID=UPI003CE4B96B